MPTRHLLNLTPDELADAFAQLGLARFRVSQVLDWVYRKGADHFEAMANLSKADRQTLTQHFHIADSRIIREQLATDGVRKLLVAWPTSTPDNPAARSLEQPPLPVLNKVAPTLETECVMIPAGGDDSRLRRTACISSQVGCPVGCKFCASGLGGLDGNLTAGQIVEQVWRLSFLTPDQPITNVVFMGMGEPLANFDQVTRAIAMLRADWGLNIGARRITVSTVGLPAQIRRLADQQIQCTLAISLHAPNDDIRRSIIPWADFVSIDQLLDAGRYYFDKTGREITLEYILLGRVNDQPEHARELARIARTLRTSVNLIRYNEVAGLEYRRPHTDDVHQFQRILQDQGVKAIIRASRGRDIAAACGQLRHESLAT